MFEVPDAKRYELFPLLLAFLIIVDFQGLINQVEFVEKTCTHRKSLHGVRAKQMPSWRHGLMHKSPNLLA